MFNLGAEKLLVIFFIALLVVGPDKLPELARKAGRALSELRRMSGGFQDEFRRALDEPLQTFTKEFNLGSSDRSQPANGEAGAEVTEVAAGDAPAPGDATATPALGDTPAEPAMDEQPSSSTLSPTGAHAAPEKLGPAVQPVPSLHAEPSAAEPRDAPAPAETAVSSAELPAWVFGEGGPADTPSFH